MDTIQYKKSINQVNSILKKIDKALVNQLPDNVIEYFKNNSIDEYEYQYDGDTKLIDANLFPETKEILTALYQEYWCNEAEKENLDDILNANSIEKKNILNMKYDYTDMFRSDNVKEIVITVPNKRIAKKKQSMLSKILNKIKRIF